MSAIWYSLGTISIEIFSFIIVYFSCLDKKRPLRFSARSVIPIYIVRSSTRFFFRSTASQITLLSVLALNSLPHWPDRLMDVARVSNSHWMLIGGRVHSVCCNVRTSARPYGSGPGLVYKTWLSIFLVMGCMLYANVWLRCAHAKWGCFPFPGPVQTAESRD